MGAITVARAGTLAKPTAAAAFSPDDIAGLRAWFDASQITGKSDGDAISQLDDLSGNGFHAVQATGSKQPVYRADFMKGNAVVEFDGADDVLLSSLNNADSSVTLFIVGRFLSGAGSTRRLMAIGSPSASIFNDNGADWSFYSNQAGSAQNLGGDPFTKDVFSLVFDSASSASIYRDGTLAATFDPSDNFNLGGALALGASNGTGDFGKCQIAEVIAYDSALGSPDRVAVEDYLREKWTSPISDPPQDITGLLSYFDASAIIGKSDSDPVDFWEDLSGYDRHARQTTNTIYRPTYQAAEFNGLPVLRFDGTDDFLDSLLANTDETITAFIVGQFAATQPTANGRMLMLGGGGGSLFIPSSGGNYQWYSPVTGLGVAGTTRAVVSLTFNSSTSLDARVNGGSAVNINPASDYRTGSLIKFGATGAFGAEAGACDIAEFRLYDHALDSTERAAVVNALASKWGVTL